MIAKAKSIAHGGVSLGYITRQGKAQVVKLNHLPEDASPQAIYGYMKLHQKLREEEFQRRPLKNNMIRMEISPSKEESKGWTLEDWKQLAEDFVQAFDRVRLPGEEKLRRSPCRLPNSQYIITLHTDSKSGIPHLHLDCNRVDMDNCLNSDHGSASGPRPLPRRSTVCAAGNVRKTGSRRTKPASRRIASRSWPD